MVGGPGELGLQWRDYRYGGRYRRISIVEHTSYRTRRCFDLNIVLQFDFLFSGDQ